MKKTGNLGVAFLLIACCMTVEASTQITARVTADRVNLRARPVLESETVGQAGEGELLNVRSVETDWVQVAPPATTEFWVHGDLIENDTVVVNKLNVRAGASINYSIVGALKKGDKVTVTGRFGEWLKIQPPDDSSLWISREFVELIYPASAMPPSEFPAPSPADAADAGSGLPPPDTGAYADTPLIAPQEMTDQTPALAASVPTDLKLLPLNGQGRVVQREGELKRSPSLFRRSPGPFRLVKRDGNRLITTAYLRGNSKQLDALLDQHLIVQGREYWVENVRIPLVVIEAIQKRTFY